GHATASVCQMSIPAERPMLKNAIPTAWAKNPFVCNVIDSQIVGIDDDALGIALDWHSAPFSREPVRHVTNQTRAFRLCQGPESNPLFFPCFGIVRYALS